MKVTLESTNKIVTLVIDGADVPARMWQGKTENGVECHAFITRICCHKDLDSSQFERELREHVPARAELKAIPLRMII